MTPSARKKLARKVRRLLSPRKGEVAAVGTRCPEGSHRLTLATGTRRWGAHTFLTGVCFHDTNPRKMDWKRRLRIALEMFPRTKFVFVETYGRTSLTPVNHPNLFHQ